MSPEARVLKFGGSSVADPVVMRRAAMVATASLSRDGRPGSGPGVVVVSALGGVTRELVAIAELALAADAEGARTRVSVLEERHRNFLAALELETEERLEIERRLSETVADLRGLLEGAGESRFLREPRSFEDAVLATGELLASRFFWAELRNLGVPCDWIDARRFLRTDARFRSAAPDLNRTRDLVRAIVLPSLQAGRSVVVPGFVGSTEDGRSTTMGFEASDLTATVLGSVLGAREVQIWTDVSGVMSADPRVVEGAQPVPHLGYESAREIAFLGARVLHPDTMSPARGAGIAVRVANSRRPGDPGTTIDGLDPTGVDAERVVVAARRAQSVLSVPVREGMARPVLAFLREVAARERLADALFAIRPHSPESEEVLVVASDPRSLSILAEASSQFGEITVSDGWSTVSVVSCGSHRPSGHFLGEAALEWDGLHRSRGLLVRDRDRDNLVREIHSRALALTKVEADTMSS